MSNSYRMEAFISVSFPVDGTLVQCIHSLNRGLIWLKISGDSVHSELSLSWKCRGERIWWLERARERCQRGRGGDHKQRPGSGHHNHWTHPEMCLKAPHTVLRPLKVAVLTIRDVLRAIYAVLSLKENFELRKQMKRFLEFLQRGRKKWNNDYEDYKTILFFLMILNVCENVTSYQNMVCINVYLWKLNLLQTN